MPGKDPKITKMFSDDHLSQQGDRCARKKRTKPCDNMASFFCSLRFGEETAWRRERLCEYHARRFCARHGLVFPGQLDFSLGTQQDAKPSYAFTLIRIPVSIVIGLDRAWKRGGHARSRTALVVKILEAWLREPREEQHNG